MTVIIKVPGVNWSGMGFRNVNPFISVDDLEFAFDFQSRSSRFSDITGNTADLVPYINDRANGVVEVDPSVIKDKDGGKGIRIDGGFLETGINLSDIPLDGSEKFTIMIAGGQDGTPLPQELRPEGSSDPNFALLFDNGANVSTTGFDMQARVKPGDFKFGARINSFTPNLNEVPDSYPFMAVAFLTFDGGNWTFIDKTTGFSLTKTNADLGISGTLTVANGMTTAKIGHHDGADSITHGAPPTLYQLSKWSRVLSSSEIEEQYQRTISSKSGVGL